MKTRSGFVSNSSTSSFVAVAYPLQEEERHLYKEILAKGLLYRIFSGYDDDAEYYLGRELFGEDVSVSPDEFLKTCQEAIKEVGDACDEFGLDKSKIIVFSECGQDLYFCEVDEEELEEEDDEEEEDEDEE